MIEQPSNPIAHERMGGTKILIVDDQEVGRARAELLLRRELSGQAVSIASCATIQEALDFLSRNHPAHVVLLDKHLGTDRCNPFHDGIDSLPLLLGLQPHLQILMVTSSKEIQDVVRAMNAGACGYVPKEGGRDNDSLLLAQVARAIRVAKMEIAKIRGERGVVTSKAPRIGGNSKAMRQALNQAEACAESSKPILILGESGTGKTHLARYSHDYRSAHLGQPDRPFFSVNIAATPKDLVESTLFGHEKGAFTGATELKQGYIELANEGTLFMDEIGEASLETQVKLLKVLEEHTYIRVGGKLEMHSSFKLICATNRNLEEMVKKGSFREDLFMRINTFVIHLPALKDRTEDIPDIIRALLPRCCADNKVLVDFDELPVDFIEHLCTLPLKGNVRGLDQYLSRLLVLSPRDKQGRPIMKMWRVTLGLHSLGASPQKGREELSLDELQHLRLNVVGPGFPGLAKLMESIRERVLLDAKSKLRTHRQIAQALGVSDATISDHIKRLVLSGKLAEN